MLSTKRFFPVLNLLLALFVIVPVTNIHAQKKPVKKVTHKHRKPIHRKTKVNYRKKPIVDTAIGFASFYSDKFIGRKTANGEKFSQKKLTCAHNTLPFGTYVKVTNLKNDKFVLVKVNDRLHHNNPRLVDLSRAAASKIGFSQRGVIKVKVEVVKPDSLPTGSSAK